MIPFVRTLRMAGLGECAFGPLHYENEEFTEVRLLYAGFLKGEIVETCLTYIAR